MIVKRRVTKQFVALANEIVRDRSIPLDAHGMLHYLLSLPDDWEIKLHQIEKFWTIGRAKRQRIFQDLLKAGWMKYERILDDEKNYIGSRWIVTDDPVPTTTEIDAIEEDGEPLAATKTAPSPESQAPDGSALQGDRERSQATDGSGVGRKTRPTENRSPESRRNTSDENLESTNTTETARDETDDGEPPPYFGQLLKLWPAENMASAFACEKVFSRMTAWQRKLARDGIKPYLDDCRGKGQNRLCDLRTYLDERRWERFVGTQGTVGKTLFAVQRGTPQAVRWREYFERIEPKKLVMFDEQMRTGRSYTVPSEWPPAIGPRKQYGTDPPDSLTEEDAKELAKFGT